MRIRHSFFPRILCCSLLIGCGHTAPQDEQALRPVKFVNAKYEQHITQLNQLDPAYLFIYANDLFLNGQKDEAVFWFYVAQYRAMMIGTMENDHSAISPQLYQHLAAEAGTPVLGQMVVLGNGLNRGQLYNYIHSGLGIAINGYAGSNMDNWVKQMERALAFEHAHPFDPFQAVPADQLDAAKLPEAKQRAEGMKDLIAFIKANKETLQQQRAALMQE